MISLLSFGFIDNYIQIYMKVNHIQARLKIFGSIQIERIKQKWKSMYLNSLK